MQRTFGFKKATRLLASTGIAFALAGGVSSVAHAQDNEVAEEESADSGNVIIVTARFREENLQDVPLAITAFDEEALERQAIQDLDDVARFTPGFAYEDFSGGFAAPVIRGQSQTRVTALETNVSTFFDGIYIPRSWAVDVGTTNVERIEIVKGPQSARYGRNAFAGAINYAPRTAELDGENLSGSVEGTIGSDERYDVGAFVNLSLSDRLAIAGSYNYSSFDGSWGNAHPFADLDIDGPSTSGNVGGWENTAYSISATADLDAVKLEAGYFRFETENEARASRGIADSVGGIIDPAVGGLTPVTNCGATRFFAFSPLICGDFPDPADEVVADPRSFGSHAETGIFRAAATVEFSDDVNLQYIFGNINGDINIGTTFEPDPINCGTLVGPAFGLPPLCNFQPAPIGGINYDSHELRLTFEGDSIRATLGGYYSDGRDDFFFTSTNIAPLSATRNVPLDPNATSDFFNVFNIVLRNETTETEVKSLFGEVQWTSGDGATRIGVEGRYAETEITATDNRASTSLNDTFKDFSPRLTIERDLNDDVLLYATAARGAKSGGFNASSRQVQDRTFDDESNWTYELGAKSVLANGRVTLNGAIFYTDWSNIQINSADEDPANPDDRNVPSIIQNLDGATIYGIELAAFVELTDNLSLDATFSHSEATYKDGVIDSRFSRGAPGLSAPCDDVVCSTTGDIGGNDLERQSPTQASLGLQYEGEFGNGNEFYIRTDGSWQSDFFGDSANLSVVPSRLLVNASAGTSIGPVNVRLWVRNLFDEKYTSNAFIVLLPFGNTYGQFFGERRTFGVTTSLDF